MLANFVRGVNVGCSAVGDVIAHFVRALGTLPVQVRPTECFQLAPILFVEFSLLHEGDAASVTAIAYSYCAGTEIAQFGGLDVLWHATAWIAWVQRRKFFNLILSIA